MLAIEVLICIIWRDDNDDYRNTTSCLLGDRSINHGIMVIMTLKTTSFKKTSLSSN